MSINSTCKNLFNTSIIRLIVSILKLMGRISGMAREKPSLQIYLSFPGHLYEFFGLDFYLPFLGQGLE